MSAWTVIPEQECLSIWKEFEARLDFAPSVAQFPGIREPTPSETFSTIAVWDSPEAAQRLTIDIDDVALRVISSFTSTKGRVIALDWQHECYYFTPSLYDGAWEVPSLPDGDYAIFLSEDLQDGWFGHPWEPSICVFGERATASLAEGLPILFSRRIRRNGVSNDDAAFASSPEGA